jgi:hypothetical protein
MGIPHVGPASVVLFSFVHLFPNLQGTRIFASVSFVLTYGFVPIYQEDNSPAIN